MVAIWARALLAKIAAEQMPQISERQISEPQISERMIFPPHPHYHCGPSPGKQLCNN